MTDYWDGRVFDAVFHGVEFRVHEAHVGLGWWNEGNVVELTASDYHRKLIEWNPVVDGTIDNANQIIWTAVASWGAIHVAFIADTFAGGNILHIYDLGDVTTGAGSKIIIEPGLLSVS